MSAFQGEIESQREESNLRPADYESAALPTELRWPIGRMIMDSKKIMVLP